ncbi:nuclear transport factor 2 family protein [Xanthobacter sp. KR7-225]|uniref:nuclear transport factor 2 family protein n=1 Tax=Xanthobacter sp. KR7-225 TaxID=3156613 RepID=UPI0032B331E4
MSDEAEIMRAVENWILWRDQGDWDRFRTLWHPDGVMIATWFQGSFEQFIENSRRAWEMGALVHHFLGGATVTVNDRRAVSQAKMNISVRAPVHDVLCDVTCTGRFFDYFERLGKRWLLSRRQVIYEKDRLDPVEPGQTVKLDQALLERFPVGYRHLAYLQLHAGHSVLMDLPGLRGAAVQRLYAGAECWLRSESDWRTGWLPYGEHRL